MTLAKHSLPPHRLAEFGALFGAPVILSSESLQDYNRLLEEVLACLKVNDVIEFMKIREYVYNEWLVKRYSLHQTLAVERQHQETSKFQAEKERDRKKRIEARAADLARHMASSPPEVDKLLRLEETVDAAAEELDEITLRAPTDIEHNVALQRSIAYIEQLDVLITRATSRRNDAFKLLQLYRDGLGHQVREATEKVIDADCQDVTPSPRKALSKQSAPKPTKAQPPVTEEPDWQEFLEGPWPPK